MPHDLLFTHLDRHLQLTEGERGIVKSVFQTAAVPRKSLLQL
ncbi:MAG: hypothetical protein AAF399_29940 [Bacteroidota bacterium]